MSHHRFTQSQSVQKISQYHMKNKTAQQRKSQRQHLLSLMVSFTKQSEDPACEQPDELCCYDRIKKLVCSAEQSPSHEQMEQLNNAVAIQKKINQLQASLRASQHARGFQVARRGSSPHILKKVSKVDQIKKECLDRFLAHRVGNKQKAQEEINRMVATMIDERADELLEQKKVSYTRLMEQNEQINKKMLQNQLQLQGLKIKEKAMREYIQQLQLRFACKKQTKNSEPKTYAEQFVFKYSEAFGQMTIEELKSKLDLAINKCLQQFERVENRNQDRMKEQQKLYDSHYSTMKNQIHQLEQRENSLISNLKTIKLNNQISQIEVDQLYKAKEKLEHLEKVILSLYNEWHSSRSENEKRLLSCTGNLSESYSYEEMIRYMVEFNKKYNTNDKLNDFLFKVLRGVQKIKRVIAPDMCNQKLDALSTLEHIQKWIKMKASKGAKGLFKKTVVKIDPTNYLKDHQ